MERFSRFVYVASNIGLTHTQWKGFCLFPNARHASRISGRLPWTPITYRVHSQGQNTVLY